MNAQLKGLKADGATDNTAALQALLNSLTAGSTIYFPKGIYKINGPISITKPVTLFGESGTVFNCQGATQHVFNINKAGSATATMSGVTITGLTIEGPGLETTPAMIYGRYLQNFHVSYVKIHNVGYAGIRIDTCTDVLIEHSNFDNIFRTGYGYSVCIVDRCDRVTIRDNFFVTKGRHYIATGAERLPFQSRTMSAASSSRIITSSIQHGRRSTPIPRPSAPLSSGTTCSTPAAGASPS